uniref:Heterogeneous nuclear ribonucleoprotein U-like protein 1 n=1 Tax=Phallusia mammillata TaxID=59560 RepID=A0A6F9DFA5_9ASCI|nr:heterogeneous nuclear ribonucleoprotein U-like protein 1 [Phallusia mammillata]
MQSYFGAADKHVKLDDYICDLNLDITDGGYACIPQSSDGFSYMWGGVKATHGIRSGKVCYEVKVADYCEATNKDPTDTYVARVGWSTDSATLQLGEDKNSFGFGGTGKKSANRKFLNYGRRYEKGDVVGCYLAMENGWVDISYSVNGRYCGSAFKIRWMTDEALFPHVLTKNCKLETNFGQAPHPYFSLQPGYKLIDHIPVELRIPGVRAPLTQRECEVIMMVGLPGVGKSTWAMNYAKIHPSKKYVVLGTDSIIDKMRVMGLPRKNNFTGRWDVLIKQASECFNMLLKKASNLPRNLILDQTNVYASARRRKVKQYREKGYIVNAMVLVPRDEDMIRRSQQRTVEEGKEVPEAAVLDMKANFSLPDEKEQLFDNITFLELQRPDAQQIVEQYNREAMNRGHHSNQQRGGINQNQAQRNQYDRMSATSLDKSYSTPSPHGPPRTPQSNPRSSMDRSYGERPLGAEDRHSGSQERKSVPQFSRWENEQDTKIGVKRTESPGMEPPEKYRRSAGPPTNTGYAERNPQIQRHEAGMGYQQKQQQQQAFTDKWNEQVSRPNDPNSGHQRQFAGQQSAEIPPQKQTPVRQTRWGPERDTPPNKPVPQHPSNMKTEYDDYGYSQQARQPREQQGHQMGNQESRAGRDGNQQRGYYESPQSVAKTEPRNDDNRFPNRDQRQPYPPQNMSRDSSFNRDRGNVGNDSYNDSWEQDDRPRQPPRPTQNFQQNQGQRLQEPPRQDSYRDNYQQNNQQYPKQEQYDETYEQYDWPQQSNVKQEPNYDQSYEDPQYNEGFGTQQYHGDDYNEWNNSPARNQNVPQRQKFQGVPGHGSQGDYGQQNHGRVDEGDFQQGRAPQGQGRLPAGRPGPQNRPQYDQQFDQPNNRPLNNRPPMRDNRPPLQESPYNASTTQQRDLNPQSFDDQGPPQRRKPLLEAPPDRKPHLNEPNFDRNNGRRAGPNGQGNNFAQNMHNDREPQFSGRERDNQYDNWSEKQGPYSFEQGNAQIDLSADDKKQLQFFEQQQSMLGGNRQTPLNDKHNLKPHDPVEPRQEARRSGRDEIRGERSGRQESERNSRDRSYNRDGDRPRREDRGNRDERRTRDEEGNRSDSRSRDDRGSRDQRRDREDSRSRRVDRNRDEARVKREDRRERSSSASRRSDRRSPERRSPRRSDPGRGGPNRRPINEEQKPPQLPGGGVPQLNFTPKNEPPFASRPGVPKDLRAGDMKPGLHKPGADPATISKLASVDFDKLKASLANIRKSQQPEVESDWIDPNFGSGVQNEGGLEDMDIDEPVRQNRPMPPGGRMPFAPRIRPGGAPRGPLLRTPGPMGRGQPRGLPRPVRPQFRGPPPDMHSNDMGPRKTLLATPGDEPIHDEQSFGDSLGMGDFPPLDHGVPPPRMGHPGRIFRGPGGPRPRMRGFPGGMRFRGPIPQNGPPGMRMRGRGMRPPRPRFGPV